MSKLEILETETQRPKTKHTESSADFIVSANARRKLVKAVDAFGRDVGEASWQVAVALDSVAGTLNNADRIVGIAEKMAGDWEPESMVKLAQQAAREMAQFNLDIDPVKENVNGAADIMAVASTKRASELDALQNKLADYCATAAKVGKFIRFAIDNNGDVESAKLNEFEAQANQLKTEGREFDKSMRAELKRLESERLKWLEKPGK